MWLIAAVVCWLGPESPAVSSNRVVQISENYKDYSPPRWIRYTIERLLSSIPESYTQGLSTIVLADSTAAPKLHKWRSPRRHRKGEMLGAYHRKLNGDPAWIQLVVDRIVKEIPRPLRWLQFARDVTFARVLFHEIGHHLDNTVGSTARAGEPAAEAWRMRLSRTHFLKHYPYLRVVAPFGLYLLRVLRLRGPQR